MNCSILYAPRQGTGATLRPPPTTLTHHPLLPGTLEVRRFHSTLDEDVAVAWASFCVGFVEAFGKGRAGRGPPTANGHGIPTAEAAPMESDESVLDLDVPLQQGLSRLQAAQEAATPEELMRLTAGYVDPRTAEFLLSAACGSRRG